MSVHTVIEISTARMAYIPNAMKFCDGIAMSFTLGPLLDAIVGAVCLLVSDTINWCHKWWSVCQRQVS
jgi:hypothetical protein